MSVIHVVHAFKTREGVSWLEQMMRYPSRDLAEAAAKDLRGLYDGVRAYSRESGDAVGVRVVFFESGTVPASGSAEQICGSPPVLKA